MPEGPSLLILKELISPLLNGKKITAAYGNAKIDMELLQKKKIQIVRTWGKQLFICLPDVTVRVHFLLFGSYSVDEQTKLDKSLRLAIKVPRHAVYFYTCSVRLLQENIDDLYDWEADVLSDKWNPVKARKKLKEMPKTVVCDALLDQQVFSGVGNIIKNEVLFRIRLHPETLVKHIPPRKLSELIKEARVYSFDFLHWKKEFTLRKHWLAHTKKICPRCDIPFIKKKCGKTNRRTFYCENCQVKYS
jgi:endonuclease-8